MVQDIWYTNKLKVPGRKGFQEQGEDAILVLDIIRIEVQEKVNQCARPRCKKRCTKKCKAKSKTRHRTQRCKSKTQIKGARHRLLQTCKTDSTKMQHKGALHMRHMGREGTSHTGI